MEKISFCMIAKNESLNIKRCLQSVENYVDEMIVVDTGSIDNTPQIAEEVGARVYHFDWQGDFSAARNYALERAKGDWILFLDADEELTQGSGERLQEMVQQKDTHGYFVKIINYIGDEGWIETTSDIVFRLFRNSPKYKFHGAIHEQIVDAILQQEPNAKYQSCEDVVILHYGYTEKEILSKDKKKRNLEIIYNEIKINPTDVLLRYHYGVELFRNEEYEKASVELIKVAQNMDHSTFIFPKLLRYIVMSFYNCKKYAEGESFSKNALQFFPDYADLYYFQGLILYEQKKYSSAFESFNTALSMPEQATHYASFGGTRGYRSSYYCGKISAEFLNFDAALTFYVRALRENPYFITALEEIIKILNPRMEADYTRECLNKVFEFENFEAVVSVARISYQQGGYVLALEFLNKIENPIVNTAELQLMKAVCYIQTGEMLSALRILKNFQPKSHLYPIALINLYYCYWLQDNKTRLRNVMKKILELGISVQTVAVLNLFKDSLYKKTTNLQVSIEGDSCPLFMDLFRRTVDAGHIDKAQKLVDKLAPNSLSELSYDIGKVYFELGYAQEAEKFLLNAWREKPEDSTIIYLIGQNYELLGQKNSAITYYRKAIADKKAQPKFYIKIIKIYQEMIEEILQDATRIYPEAQQIRELFAEMGGEHEKR